MDIKIGASDVVFLRESEYIVFCIQQHEILLLYLKKLKTSIFLKRLGYLNEL